MTRLHGWTIGAGIIAAGLALGVVGCGAATVVGPAQDQATTSTVSKPSGRIPAAATAVTLTMKSGLGAHAKGPAPVTITNQATVGKLAALIDGLPLFPSGTYNCPMDDGSSLMLTFSAGRGGPALATATVALSGCQGVDLTTSGKQQPGLGTPDGGRPDAAQALKLAGLHWNMPR